MFVFGLSGPKEMTDWWNIGVDANNPMDMHMARCGIHYGIMDFMAEYMFLKGMDITKVVGFVYLWAAKMFIEALFVLKTVDKLNMDKPKHLLWLAVELTTVITLLL